VEDDKEEPPPRHALAQLDDGVVAVGVEAGGEGPRGEGVVTGLAAELAQVLPQLGGEVVRRAFELLVPLNRGGEEQRAHRVHVAVEFNVDRDGDVHVR
jgi:hypothetical protein